MITILCNNTICATTGVAVKRERLLERIKELEAENVELRKGLVKMSHIFIKVRAHARGRPWKDAEENC